jgi:homoserine O-acetyltransferase
MWKRQTGKAFAGTVAARYALRSDPASRSDRPDPRRIAGRAREDATPQQMSALPGFGGNQPEKVPRIATVWFATGTSGGNQGLQAKGPTRVQADAFIDDRLAKQKVGDANDVMYQWDASRDFDPAADLDKITAHMLVINSADDERNPPELGVLEREMKRIPKGQVYIIPGSPETRGHGTTGSPADLYARQLADFLASVPKSKK